MLCCYGPRSSGSTKQVSQRQKLIVINKKDTHLLALNAAKAMKFCKNCRELVYTFIKKFLRISLLACYYASLAC